MKRLLVLLVLLLPAPLLLLGPRPTAAQGDGGVQRGLELYARHCAICHGTEGRGDGPAAYLLSPKPRDFARGEFRLVTTRNGVPADEDLLRVLEKGMPGSAMPPWDRLPEADRKLVAGTVKGFWRADLFRLYADEGMSPDELRTTVMEETTPGAAVSFEAEGEATLARVARGRVVYTQACAPCHGREGRGETTQKLLDSQGYPAPARDFTKGIFKGGPEARQLYARLRAGMKGTAMPTFGMDTLSDEEAWSVVHYIRTLVPAGVQERQEQKTQSLRIRRVKALPASPQEWWDALPPAYVALMPLWWRDKRPEGVLVTAAHDGTTLALRLVWEDETENVSNLRQEDFHDGAAVQLSWDEDPPFFGMGDPAAPVTIWSWKASWQRDEKGFLDIEAIYPAMHLDSYFPSQTDLKAGERPDPAAVSAPHHDPTFLSGWGAGNPMSNPERASAVEVAGAKGQGSLTTALREAQVVQGSGTWDRGIWTLEMRTKMAPEGLKGLSIAFAVWDGASNDRNGQKSVSIWHRIDLED
jgi:mono/diheme cytochrome c family protein